MSREEYLTGELLGVSRSEIKAYSQACDELYTMYERAAQHVIEQKTLPRTRHPL